MYMANKTCKLFATGILFLLSFTTASGITPDELLKIDLNKNYKSYKINELRLIRSMVYAKHGFLFMESELRDFFTIHYNWYDTLIYKNAELQWDNKTVPPIILSDEETEFVNKIDKLIEEKNKDSFYTKNGQTFPELKNIWNNFGEKDFPDNFRELLSKNGFVIQKDTLEQLFHLYENNHYSNTPSFITTDLFLQLFHSYFSFTLKELEKEKLTGLVISLSEAMYNESLKYTTSKNEQVVKMANFNACFFAVAYTLLTDQKLNVPNAIVGQYVNEIAKVNNGVDYFSALFNSPVPYSLFIPRGHYTRTEEQKRYFKAMMWLQIAPFCLSDNNLLKNSCFNAMLLKTGKGPLNKPMMEMYNSIYEPIAFLVGDADNLSVRDICNIYDKHKITDVGWLADPNTIKLVAMKLRELEREKDQIQPKIKLSCYPKINFMPQRYLVDNDILQQFADTTINAEKALPKGLEVFGVMGAEMAKDILYKQDHENKKWKDYDSVMAQQTGKFATFKDWDKTVYNKWLQSLLLLNKTNKSYPYFMQNRGWQLKNLNTSLASWSELKHDVILYGEQPSAAESGCGGDELPPPVTVGYVEPNIQFWSSCKELMTKNELFITKYNLQTEELNEKTSKVKELLDFFLTVSQKEINYQPLTNEEYDKIESIGGECDYLSLSMLNPYVSLTYWEEVTGPDKTIAVIADVYTRNVPKCPKNAILHEATGFGNVIHVLVEIEGKLYLTRGATFSYYEFPYEERLTDERWYDMLRQKEIAPVDWMDEITVP
jgi:hypothetical protein